MGGVGATRSLPLTGEGPRIRIQEDPKYHLVHKVGSITLDHGVKGDELTRELNSAATEFIYRMEQRGLKLYPHPDNPKWAYNEDGSPLAVYAIDWENKRKPRIYTDGDGQPLPRRRETSIEESEGEVEYRIVGIFWAPEAHFEVVVDRKELIAAERAAKNPTVFAI